MINYNSKTRERKIISNSYLRQNFLYESHEFQAKELLKKYNVPVQEGIACGTVHEAEEAYARSKHNSEAALQL